MPHRPASLLIADSDLSLSEYFAVSSSSWQAQPSPCHCPSPILSAGDGSFRCRFPAAVAALLCNAVFFSSVGLLQVEGRGGRDRRGGTQLIGVYLRRR